MVQINPNRVETHQKCQFFHILMQANVIVLQYFLRQYNRFSLVEILDRKFINQVSPFLFLATTKVERQQKECTKCLLPFKIFCFLSPYKRLNSLASSQMLHKLKLYLRQVHSKDMAFFYYRCERKKFNRKKCNCTRTSHKLDLYSQTLVQIQSRSWKKFQRN